MELETKEERNDRKKIVSTQTDSSINIMISALKYGHNILFDRCKSNQMKCSIFNIQIAHLFSLTNPFHIAFGRHFNILCHIIIDIHILYSNDLLDCLPVLSCSPTIQAKSEK